MSATADSDESTGAAVRRYSHRPLPPYRHQPGVTPHPERSPEGHMAGQFSWPEGRELFLYGVDLFNYGYYWEAHAAWERLWTAAPRGERASVFFQGLIQVSAALVKWRAGATGGARRLGAKGLAKVRGEGSEGYLGVELERFAGEVVQFLEGGGPPPLLRIAFSGPSG